MGTLKWKTYYLPLLGSTHDDCMCMCVCVQEIDGKALMLLRSDMVMKYMGLKLGPALKLCHHIERLKQGKQWTHTHCQSRGADGKSLCNTTLLDEGHVNPSLSSEEHSYINVCEDPSVCDIGIDRQTESLVDTLQADYDIESLCRKFNCVYLPWCHHPAPQELWYQTHWKCSAFWFVLKTPLSHVYAFLISVWNRKELFLPLMSQIAQSIWLTSIWHLHLLSVWRVSHFPSFTCLNVHQLLLEETT